MNARPVVTPAAALRPMAASASTIARAASTPRAAIVLVGPVGEPPRGDEREALVVVDDLVEAAFVSIDDGLGRSERVLGERQGGRRVGIEIPDPDEHDGEPAELGQPAGVAGPDPGDELARQEGREQVVRQVRQPMWRRDVCGRSAP